MLEKKSIALDLSDYAEKGLYLILKDASRLVLTRKNIEKVTAEFWNDPQGLPLRIKETIEFQRCPFCPLKGRNGFCDALRPILPFLEVIDKYVSFDKVTAIFKGEEKDLLYVSQTTMQEALKYISVLSLMQYCQVGRKYWKFYFGIIPLMGGKEAAMRLYLNIYWLYKKDKEEIEKIIAKFNEEIRISAQNQVKRLNLLCKNDAFLNAFVNAQIGIEFLSLNMEDILKVSFENFEKNL